MAYRPIAPEVFDSLRRQPGWSVRVAAHALGVSVGVVSRWRKMIAAGTSPRAPGRPRVTAADRLEVKRQRTVIDPVANLTRMVRRLYKRGHRMSLDEARELHIDLYQTCYSTVIDPVYGIVGAELDERSVVVDAIGKKVARSFLKRLADHAFSRQTARCDDAGDESDQLALPAKPMRSPRHW